MPWWWRVKMGSSAPGLRNRRKAVARRLIPPSPRPYSQRASPRRLGVAVRSSAPALIQASATLNTAPVHSGRDVVNRDRDRSTGRIRVIARRHPPGPLGWVAQPEALKTRAGCAFRLCLRVVTRSAPVETIEVWRPTGRLSRRTMDNRRPRATPGAVQGLAPRLPAHLPAPRPRRP
jgi:hypothetical protein